MTRLLALLLLSMIESSLSWVPDMTLTRIATTLQASTVSGSVHGQNSCFLPLKQLDQDFYAPRIVQVSELTNIYLANERIGGLTDDQDRWCLSWAYETRIHGGQIRACSRARTVDVRL